MHDPRHPLMAVAALLLLAAVSILGGCTNDDDDGPTAPDETGVFELALTDAPVDVDDVILDVDAVHVHRADADSTAGWEALGVEPMMVHLLDLTNGVTQPLGETELLPGLYDQVRLVLGDSNQVVIDDVEHPLVVPSSQQSGFKIHHEFMIREREIHRAILDVDAARSVHRTGQGVHMLRPAMRMQSLADAGDIAGVVLPVAAEPYVWTVAGGDTVQTFVAAQSGRFRLVALPTGTYDVHCVPRVDDWDAFTLSDVQVEAMQITDVDTVMLSDI